MLYNISLLQLLFVLALMLEDEKTFGLNAIDEGMTCNLDV